MNNEIIPMSQPSAALIKATDALNAKIAEQRYVDTVARLRVENELYWANWIRERDVAAPLPMPLARYGYAMHMEGNSNE